MTERLALVGAGVIGKRHLKAIAETRAASIVAIADPAPATEALAQDLGVPHFEDAEAMLSATTPSGVIVATPTEFHIEPCLQALDAGCHLLVEKPIAATVDEADTIARFADERGLHVLVGHHRRYYPQIERAREIVRGDMLGQLVAVSGLWAVRKPDDYFDPDWRKRWQAGPVLTNLIHEVDYLRHIVGDILSVTGEAAAPVKGYEKEDVAALILRFKNGALGSFVLTDQGDSPWAWEFASGENPVFPESGRNCIRFVGTRGALEFPNLRHWVSDGEVETWNTPKISRDIPLELGDAFVRQIDHFADVIAGRSEPRITAKDATETLKATLAVLEGSRLGRRIDL